MHKYEFTAYLANETEITEEAANALFDAGCDDASPASSGGVVWMMFHREASDLESAIRSAVADVQQAGYRIERIELDCNALSGLSGSTV